MQDAQLLVPLAEIAGVFVGFGTLIAVRSGGPTEPQVVSPMRAMVSMGMLTMVAALTPGALSRFDLAGHQLWAVSSAFVLAGWIVLIVVSFRTPEYRTGWAAEIEKERAQRPGMLTIVGTAFYVLYMMAVSLTPIVIMLGLVPDLELALYYALVVLILLGGAGWSLLGLVFMERLPEGA